jgi:hypothetical protein
MAAPKKERRSSQVPGQFLGYSLQTTRALMHLLQANPGSFVSVEVLDDVATTNGAGASLEQVKSNRVQNPIADRSPELWKTLANWVRAVQGGHVDLERTRFEIFLSKRRRGPIAEAFSRAATVEEATKALTSAKQVLWGNPPSGPSDSMCRQRSLLM